MQSYGLPVQTTLQEVVHLLDGNTLKLQRTQAMFEKLFGDVTMRICMPRGGDYVRHGMSIVDKVPGSERFKIGMTIDPAARFYESPWAYVRQAIKSKDRAMWSVMTVIYCDSSQRAAAMLEHVLIDHFRIHAASRCCNKRSLFDDYARFDQGSDGEAEEGPGPWCVYVVTGRRM
jgi:hypothetical protein